MPLSQYQAWGGTEDASSMTITNVFPQNLQMIERRMESIEEGNSSLSNDDSLVNAS